MPYRMAGIDVHKKRLAVGAGRMSGTLHLAQALSNRGRRGRKTDFRDAERLVKRLVSQELVLSVLLTHLQLASRS
ncbi:MAG TPA: hypothetical protein VK604_24525, partial [Bryobacteraceae bacterium]|nr:hypothetical protein [Bryobacteraceae bacterium]